MYVDLLKQHDIQKMELEYNDLLLSKMEDEKQDGAEEEFQRNGDSDDDDMYRNSDHGHRPTQKCYFDLIHKVLHSQVKVFFKLQVEAPTSSILQKYAEDIIIDAFDAKDSDQDFMRILECFFETDWIAFSEAQIQKTLRTFCYVIYSSTKLKEILLTKTNFYQRLLKNDKIIKHLNENLKSGAKEHRLKSNFFILLTLPLFTNI